MEKGSTKPRRCSLNSECEFTDMSTQKVGIYCLSEVANSILMWSHYAAGHEGYCIEFEASDSTPVFGEAQQVNYSPQYPMVEMFRMTGRQKADLTFLTKHRGWRYEREWRIIANETGPGHYPYPSQLMNRVIFGLSTSTKIKKKIREYASSRETPVRFAQATRHPHRFAIEILAVGLKAQRNEDIGKGSDNT